MTDDMPLLDRLKKFRLLFLTMFVFECIFLKYSHKHSKKIRQFLHEMHADEIPDPDSDPNSEEEEEESIHYIYKKVKQKLPKFVKRFSKLSKSDFGCLRPNSLYQDMAIWI